MEKKYKEVPTPNGYGIVDDPDPIVVVEGKELTMEARLIGAIILSMHSHELIIDGNKMEEIAGIVINDLTNGNVEIKVATVESIKCDRAQQTLPFKPEPYGDFSMKLPREDHLGNSQGPEETVIRTEAPEENSEEEDIPILEDLVDMNRIARPDKPGYVAVVQPNGDAYITDNTSFQMKCKCGKSSMYMHSGQISTPCPYCRRQWLAVFRPKKGTVKFIHYNSWWRMLWYRMIGRSPV